VDPCLGFYPISHSSTIPQITKQSSISTVHDVPSIAILSPAPFFNAVPDSAHSSSEVEDTSSSENHGIIEVVTVDEFLRRSAEKKPTKSYGRRKRRVVDLSSDSEGTVGLRSMQSCSYGVVCVLDLISRDVLILCPTAQTA
jgi:hypothetical protein